MADNFDSAIQIFARRNRERLQQGLRAGESTPPALPSDFINIQMQSGLWYIDRVHGQCVEAIAVRSVQRIAMQVARHFADIFGLPLHRGPYTLPAVEEVTR